jgi:hypothetical protein
VVPEGALETFRKMGSLRITKLIGDDILTIPIDNQNGKPLPMKENFKCKISYLGEC